MGRDELGRPQGRRAPFPSGGHRRARAQAPRASRTAQSGSVPTAGGGTLKTCRTCGRALARPHRHGRRSARDQGPVRTVADATGAAVDPDARGAGEGEGSRERVTVWVTVGSSYPVLSRPDVSCCSVLTSADGQDGRNQDRAGRGVSPCQGGGRGFESRRPLQRNRRRMKSPVGSGSRRECPGPAGGDSKTLVAAGSLTLDLAVPPAGPRLALVHNPYLTTNPLLRRPARALGGTHDRATVVLTASTGRTRSGSH
jgi:hypothetical protein